MAIIVLTLLLVVFKFWKRSPKTFALVWLFIGFGLVIFACFSRPALGFVIQPHWLATASIGFFLLVAMFLCYLQKFMNKKVWIAILLMLMLFYVSTSRQYNYRWNNQKRYCLYWLSISPQSFWPNFWLGYSYMDEKNYQKARTHFMKNLKKGVNTAEVNGNLGIVEYELNNYNVSISYFAKVLKLQPEFVDTWYYLGLNYMKIGDLKRAEEYFLHAVELDKYFISPRKELAFLYQNQGRIQEATAIHYGILTLDPQNKTSLHYIKQY